MAKGRWTVWVSGRLRAADMRRLERACALALAHRPLPLDLQLDAVTHMDDTARAFIDRLLRHGANLVGESAARWPDRFASRETGQRS